MMHRASSSIVEVRYCFSRSSVQFQGHTALKIVEFDPNWAFPDCNSSLNSPMAMKCCTKLETAMEKCPIVYQGHPSNFKVTRYKTSPILTQIGRFRTIGRSQLSNPSDLPCLLMSSFYYCLYKLPKCYLYYSAHMISLCLSLYLAGVRDSARYLCNQDWHRDGTLASFNFLPPSTVDNAQIVMATHHLVGDVHNIQYCLNGLRQKLFALK